MPKFADSYSYALYLLRQRRRSRLEIERKLKFKKFSEKEISETLRKLEKEELLDDEKFAKFYTEQLLNLSPRGEKRLRLELFNKGVDKEIVDKVLEQVIPLQPDLAQRAISKKLQRWKNLPEFERKKKAISYLQRRGFSYGVIEGVLEELNPKSQILNHK